MEHTATPDECWAYRKAQGNLGAHAPECYGLSCPGNENESDERCTCGLFLA